MKGYKHRRRCPAVGFFQVHNIPLPLLPTLTGTWTMCVCCISGSLHLEFRMGRRTDMSSPPIRSSLRASCRFCPSSFICGHKANSWLSHHTDSSKTQKVHVSFAFIARMISLIGNADYRLDRVRPAQWRAGAAMTLTRAARRRAIKTRTSPMISTRDLDSSVAKEGVQTRAESSSVGIVSVLSTLF